MEWCQGGHLQGQGGVWVVVAPGLLPSAAHHGHQVGEKMYCDGGGGAGWGVAVTFLKHSPECGQFDR